MEMVICEKCGKLEMCDDMGKAMKMAIKHKHDEKCVGTVWIFDMNSATFVSSSGGDA